MILSEACQGGVQAAIPIDTGQFRLITTEQTQQLAKRNRKIIVGAEPGPLPYGAAMLAFLTAELRRREQGWGS